MTKVEAEIDFSKIDLSQFDLSDELETELADVRKITTEVEIDLSEIDDLDDLSDSQLMDELENRTDDPDVQEWILDSAKRLRPFDAELPEAKTVVDEMKIEWFTNHFDNVTLEQLESIAK